MAQQTRIETMLPYYQRFLEAFPTIQALADSPLDQVLACWSGLGYYRRAVHMHRTARILVDQSDGRLPENFAELKKLPGIGIYMAGAIASIAFNQEHPAVDGNVKRVAARIAGISDPFQSGDLAKKTTEWVQRTMPTGKAGDFNQALMELGALVCLPAVPVCAKCPVEEMCTARILEKTLELPVRSTRALQKNEDITVVLVRDQQQRVMLRQRQESLLQGMWEFVLCPGHLQAEVLSDHLAGMGIQVSNLVFIGKSRHQFSHRVWHMISYQADWSGDSVPQGYIMQPLNDLHELAIPAAFRTQMTWLQVSNVK
jgi:A/G-specific adenine glycosylase